MQTVALVLFIFYISTSSSDPRDPEVVGTFAFDSVAECEAHAPKLIQRLMADDSTILGIAHECRDVPMPSGI